MMSLEYITPTATSQEQEDKHHSPTYRTKHADFIEVKSRTVVTGDWRGCLIGTKSKIDRRSAF